MSVINSQLTRLEQRAVKTRFGSAAQVTIVRTVPGIKFVLIYGFSYAIMSTSGGLVTISKLPE